MKTCVRECDYLRSTQKLRRYIDTHERGTIKTDSLLLCIDESYTSVNGRRSDKFLRVSRGSATEMLVALDCCQVLALPESRHLLYKQVDEKVLQPSTDLCYNESSSGGKGKEDVC